MILNKLTNLCDYRLNPILERFHHTSKISCVCLQLIQKEDFNLKLAHVLKGK